MNAQDADLETKMRKLLRLLSNGELMALVLFANMLFTYVFLLGANGSSEFYDNLYYLSERFDYLVMCIIGYNLVSKKYHIIVIPACALSAMRLINEILHITNLVKINNVLLLTTEFLILVLIVWRTSRVTY